MTVATTQGFELTVDQLIRRAYQIAGLLEAAQQPTTDDLSLGHDLLNMELDAMQADGIPMRKVAITTLTLTAGVSTYPLASSVVDAFVGIDNVVGTILPSSGNETHVRNMTRHEYMTLVNKSASSTPSFCYVQRLASVSLLFWPVPDATVTFRYQSISIPFDTSDGSKTADVDRRRQKALVWSLAHDIAVAKSQPLDRCGYLSGQAKELKTAAKSIDSTAGHGQFYVSRRRY